MNTFHLIYVSQSLGLQFGEYLRLFCCGTWSTTSHSHEYYQYQFKQRAVMARTESHKFNQSLSERDFPLTLSSVTVVLITVLILQSSSRIVVSLGTEIIIKKSAETLRKRLNWVLGRFLHHLVSFGSPFHLQLNFSFSTLNLSSLMTTHFTTTAKATMI